METSLLKANEITTSKRFSHLCLLLITELHKFQLWTFFQIKAAGGSVAYSDFFVSIESQNIGAKMSMAGFIHLLFY